MEKSEKIIIVCTSPNLGGLELYAKRELESLKHDSLFDAYAALSRGGKISEQLERFQHHKLSFINSSKIFPILSAIQLARFIDRHDINIIHMHWGYDLSLCALAKVLSRKKPKIIYTRHMRITRDKKDIFHRFLYRQVDSLLAVSRCVQKDAQNFLPLTNQQIKLLHIGVATPDTPVYDCSKTVHNYDKNISLKIGMFGRIEYGKGQHLLLQAIENLKGQGINVSAFIIGHAMNSDYLDKLKRTVQQKKLGQHINFVDFIDNPSAVMPCFDVIVLLTYCETFGLALAEAMRAGVCVIGTNAGGVPDIIEHHKSGILIEPGNSDELSTALIKLHNEPNLRKQLADQGQKRANKLFDENKHFNELKTALLNITKSKTN